MRALALAALATINILLFANAARAEYRAFELAITDTQTGKSRTVLTTLDHIQYPGYYPVKPTEAVTIVDTWMCWQRSDYFKKICPNPHPSASSSK